MNIILPLCGKGERFARKGYTLPKPCIPVFGKELIRHTLDSLCFGAEDQLYIIVNQRVSQIESILSKHYPEAKYIMLEGETRGASETIQNALPHVRNGPCLLVDGDNFYTTDIIGKIRANLTTNQIVCFETRGEPPVFSYIQVDAEGCVTAIAEKKKISDLANTGAYYFSSKDLLSRAIVKLLAAPQNDQEPYISFAIAETLDAVWKPLQIPIANYVSLGTPEQVDAYRHRTHGFLFDLDGTIVLTDDAYYKVWSEILAEYNVFLTKEIYETYIYSNSDASVKQKLLSSAKISVEELSAKKDRLFLTHLDSITVVPNVLEFLKERREEAHKIAIVTNSNRDTAEAILRHLHIRPDIVVVGAECAAPKPAPDPYLTAASLLDIPINTCIVFEDSKNGITSASSANVSCIVGISSGEGGSLQYAGADLTYPDFYIPVSQILNFKRRAHNYESSVHNSLQARYCVEDLVVSPIQLKGGFIADVVAITMKLDGVPKKAVLKLMNENDSPLNKMAHFLDLYGRENYFYESVAPFVPVHVPRCYGLVRDPEYKTIGFVLEDLRDIAVINRDLSKEPIDLSLSVISHMAKLHAAFWGKDLTRHFTGLRKHNDAKFQPAWGNFLEERLELFVSKWRAILAPHHAELVREIVGRFREIQNTLSSAPLTLTHGDIKSPNIFYRGDIPYFIDWQYIANGKGVQDLVFFMIESFSKERMVHLFPLFKSYYYQKLQEYGVTGYSFEAYSADLEAAMYHFPFFVALWFGTTPNSDLIDVNFPYFFIQRLFAFYDLVRGK